MKQRRLQGGSLAGYVIVAVLLGLVLVGGLYGIQRYNAGDMKIASSQDEGNKEQSDDEKAASDDETKKEESADEQTDEKQPQTDESSENEAAQTEELPATGPESGLLSGLALAGLTYAAVGIVRGQAHRWTSRGN